MIRDYLGAVSTAATRKLPKGDRLLFVGRTRAAIEARVGPLASADADAVVAALTALGDPDDLAAKERERLYSARRHGAAAEPPTLWKPPGKTSRRATPPGKPPGGEPAEPRPRRARTWPYRRAEPDDAVLPGPTGPAAAGPGAPESAAPESGTVEPGTVESAAPEPGMAEPGMAEPGTAGPGAAGTGSGAPGTEAPGAGATAPGRWVHIPQPRRPDEEPPANPEAGQGAAPPGRQPGTVGPGMAGRTGWVAPSGPVGPGLPTGTAGPGTANGTVGPGAANGTVGPGPAGRTVGPGASGPAVGPGTHNGAAGSGAQNGTAGAGAHNGTAAPGAQNGTAPGSRAGDTAPGPVVPAADPAVPAAEPGSGPATQPGVTPPDGTKPLSIVPGMETPVPAEEEPPGRRFGPPIPLTEAWLLAKKNPLEAVAVLVLGVGGLLYPFPLWLIGGLISLRSRHWDKRDKWLALLGPPGFAVICLLLLGASGGGGFFHALAHATHEFGLLLRVGCVLCAGFLVWRLRRGPRRRKTPPWLRGR
jgi:hypothetical protein